MAPGFVPETTPLGALARDLPETALRVTWRRPTTQPSAAPFTCSVVWVGEVVHGDVNHPRIDGKDGVAGSIPAGGSTPVLTSGNAGQFSVWGSVERAMLGRRGVRGGVVRARAGWRALPWLTVWVLDELTPRGCLPGAALCLPNGPERMIVISLAGPPPCRPYGSTRSTTKRVGPDTSRLSGFPSPAPW
jgi:hypothetical protein